MRDADTYTDEPTNDPVDDLAYLLREAVLLALRDDVPNRTKRARKAQQERRRLALQLCWWDIGDLAKESVLDSYLCGECERCRAHPAYGVIGHG